MKILFLLKLCDMKETTLLNIGLFQIFLLRCGVCVGGTNTVIQGVQIKLSSSSWLETWTLYILAPGLRSGLQVLICIEPYREVPHRLMISDFNVGCCDLQSTI